MDNTVSTRTRMKRRSAALIDGASGTCEVYQRESHTAPKRRRQGPADAAQAPQRAAVQGSLEARAAEGASRRFAPGARALGATRARHPLTTRRNGPFPRLRLLAAGAAPRRARGAAADAPAARHCTSSLNAGGAP